MAVADAEAARAEASERTPIFIAPRRARARGDHPALRAARGRAPGGPALVRSRARGGAADRRPARRGAGAGLGPRHRARQSRAAARRARPAGAQPARRRRHRRRARAGRAKTTPRSPRPTPGSCSAQPAAARPSARWRWSATTCATPRRRCGSRAPRARRLARRARLGRGFAVSWRPRPRRWSSPDRGAARPASTPTACPRARACCSASRAVLPARS